jgi:hypothetical protein
MLTMNSVTHNTGLTEGIALGRKDDRIKPATNESQNINP